MAYTERYVRSDAAGSGDGTSNLNSGANGAFTLAEAITHAATNNAQRYNIRVGTYTLSADISFPAEASEVPNIWQGFNSSIGDLESVGRASAVADLTITNFPVIEGGSSWRVASVGNYNQFINLHFRTSVNNRTISKPINAAGIQFYRCRIENTGNGASAGVLAGTNHQSQTVDCDIVWATNAAITVFDNQRGLIIGCKAYGTHATPSATQIAVGVNNIGSTASGNIVFNTGIAFEIGNGANGCFGNSVYKVTDAFRVANGLIANNVSQLVSGFLIKGVASSGSPLIISNASTTPTSGRLNTTNLGTNIKEIDAISLSEDPFTNAASGDFTLNRTAGGGLSCRARSLLFGNRTDLGAVQSAIAGGGMNLLGLGGLING